MQLPATDLRATYEVVTPFVLPHHSGSLFRGVLGRALRRTGCSAPTPCEEACGSAPGCAYLSLFAPIIAKPSPHRFLTAGSRAPAPMLPLFPAPGKLPLARGDHFSFGLRILGQYSETDAARLTAALEQLGDFPLGEDGGRLSLVEVAQRGRRERIVAPLGQDEPCAAMRITLETPAWIERKGKLRPTIDFPDLFRAAYRRLTTLCALYGTLEDSDEEVFRSLHDATSAIATEDRRLQILSWERYSIERDERLPLRGLFGSITFSGDLAPFVPFFRMAELTHIGKGTSYGLGRIRVETRPPTAP